LISGKEDPSGNLPAWNETRRWKIKPAPGAALRSSSEKWIPVAQSGKVRWAGANWHAQWKLKANKKNEAWRRTARAENNEKPKPSFTTGSEWKENCGQKSILAGSDLLDSEKWTPDWILTAPKIKNWNGKCLLAWGTHQQRDETDELTGKNQDCMIMATEAKEQKRKLQPTLRAAQAGLRNLSAASSMDRWTQPMTKMNSSARN
jgi:hypothetical protein